MNAANKPLQKDPSFWIVAVTLVGAATVAQLYFGIPWFTQRLARARPAPRTVQSQPDVARPTLDFSKKTYTWQHPQFTPGALEGTPPQVVLMPSEYAPPSGGWGQMQPGRAIGIRMMPGYVVRSAYDWPNNLRTVWRVPMPEGYFDFIANLPDNALPGLQAEIKKQWGLVAQRESFQTNAMVLTVDHADAPGLKPAGPARPQANQAGVIHFPNVPMAVIASRLETWLQVPVVDQTGLSGSYDIQLPMMPAGTLEHPALENLRTLLRDQLGLNLIATNTAVEMLVVKKANEP
jgi:uncharacterized protein (TIGR03435 family)